MSSLFLNEGRNDPNILKAIILAGGPGSGKTFVGQQLISGTGMKVVNPDKFIELMALKAGAALKSNQDIDQFMPSAIDKLQKQRMNYLNGRLGLLIDGTGKNFDRIKGIKQHLESLGYDVIMVFVNTDIDTALKRNQERDRNVDPDFLKKAHSAVQLNLGKFQDLFKGRLMIIDNSSEGTDFSRYWKVIRKFVNSPVQNRFGKQWMVQK